MNVFVLVDARGMFIDMFADLESAIGYVESEEGVPGDWRTFRGDYRMTDVTSGMTILKREARSL